MNAYPYDDLAAELRAAAEPGEQAGSPSEGLVSSVRKRAHRVGYVVVEAAADHARLRVHHRDEDRAATDRRLAGDDEFVHEAVGGGYSHVRHAHRTEETWKRNATTFADEVDAVVRAEPIDFVLLTGDPHVVDLVRDSLATASRDLLRILARDTLADGASPEELDRRVVDESTRIRDQRRTIALDVLRGQPRLDDRTGLAAVVSELREASVSTLFLDEAALGGTTLVALGDRPWLDEATGEPDTTVVPAVQALIRAAVLTGSDIVFAPVGSLPGATATAATTRWAPDGQEDDAVSGGSGTGRSVPEEVEAPATPAVPPRLTSHHRVTLEHIMSHPASRNVTWRDALSLLDQAGTVEHEANGMITVTVGAETESFDPETTKDLDVQNVVDLRRMLAGAGFLEA